MSGHSNLDRSRFLQGERLFLTPLSVDDYDPELAFLNPGSHRPRIVEVAREEFEKEIKAPDTIWFAAIGNESGARIGNVILYNVLEYHRRCHWGLKLYRKYRRQGYGTEVAHLVIRYVFEELGFNRLKGDTWAGNVASQKFQESLGFVKECVYRKERYIGGRYADDIGYGMVREDYESIYGRKQMAPLREDDLL